MDNPNVTINDLFANVRDSLKKYENKQKLVKQKRQQQRQRSASSAPLFGSLLTPPWNVNSSTSIISGAQDVSSSAIKISGESAAATPLPCISLDASLSNTNRSPSSSSQDEPSKRKRPQPFFSLLSSSSIASSQVPSMTASSQNNVVSYDKTSSLSFSLLSSSSSKPFKTMSSSISHDSATVSSSASATPSISINRQDSIPSPIPIPEYIPLCELRRRREAEALVILRSAQAKARMAAANTPKFKPLLFNKPSFNFGNSTENHDDKMADDTSAISRKRKSDDSEQESSINTYNCYSGLDTIMPRPLSGAISISTSSAASLPIPSIQSSSSMFSYSSNTTSYNSNPCYQRQWTKEEVDGLVSFADKWITSDMKKRKMNK